MRTAGGGPPAGARRPPCGTSTALVSRVPGAGDPPDRAVGILRYEQRAVRRHRDADRASPRRGIVDDEAGGEILEFAGRHAVLDDHPDHLGSGSFAAVPRTVLGRKQAAAIFRRKLLGVVDRKAERSRMGLQQNVRNRYLVPEIGARAAVPRVLIGTDVIPRPAVKRAFLHPRDVVGWHVVADAVALVGRAPHLALRIDREPDAIADASGVDAAVAAVRIEDQHIGALGLAAPGSA